ncbi:hypothetical protein F441_03381, partial [Phytophthora nicotianae CJ01A1]
SNTIDDRVTADGGAEPSATDLNAAAHGGAAPDSIVEVQEDESESAVAATGPKEKQEPTPVNDGPGMNGT